MTSNGGIPLDKAELLSVLLEALLYGFSLLMFGGTIWTLFSQQSTHGLNRKMFTIACALLLISTVHLVIHIIRVMFGLILYRDTYPGGPIAYFTDASQWPWNAKNYIYVFQTLMGDGVIIYRCYMVWPSKPVLIFLILLWCAAGISGFMCPVSEQQATPYGTIFTGAAQPWITSFWATALATNFSATLLLVFRISYINRKTTMLRSHQPPQLRQILHIIIDAGAIYTLILLVALITYVVQSNSQIVILDMVSPIISITFYMVIIRVGLAARASQMSGIPFKNTSMENGLSAERRRRMQVHVATLNENKVDQGNRLSMCKSVPSGNKGIPGKIELDSEEGDVYPFTEHAANVDSTV